MFPIRKRIFSPSPSSLPLILKPTLFLMKIQNLVGLLGLASLATSFPLVPSHSSQPQKRATYELQSPKNSSSKAVQWDHYSLVLGNRSKCAEFGSCCFRSWVSPHPDLSWLLSFFLSEWSLFLLLLLYQIDRNSSLLCRIPSLEVSSNLIGLLRSFHSLTFSRLRLSSSFDFDSTDFLLKTSGLTSSKSSLPEVCRFRPSNSLWLLVLATYVFCSLLVTLQGWNCISTYWAWHIAQPSESDAPVLSNQNDLNKILDLMETLGLLAVVRPGPYINAETSGGGFPGWLQSINATLRTGDEAWKEAYDPYAKLIASIIKPHQLTYDVETDQIGGGSVIFLQVCTSRDFSECRGRNRELENYLESWLFDRSLVLPISLFFFRPTTKT